jgi:hypothetical protein
MHQLTEFHSSSIIDAVGPPHIVVYFYFNFWDVEKQDLAGLLSSLVFQLATNSRQCLTVLTNFYKEHGRTHLNPTTDLLVACFRSVLLACPGAVIIIDALDECPALAREERVLPFLQQIIYDTELDFRLLVSSRLEYNIRQLMDRISSHTINLNDRTENRDDLAQYISQELSRPVFAQWSATTKANAMALLKHKANGM